MSALYIMRYAAGPNSGFGVIYVGRKTILGVDVGNLRYSGGYAENNGRLQGNLTVTAPQGGNLVTGQRMLPGTSIAMNFDWPENFTNGQQSILVQGKAVNVTFEKVGDLP